MCIECIKNQNNKSWFNSYPRLLLTITVIGISIIIFFKIYIMYIYIYIYILGDIVIMFLWSWRVSLCMFDFLRSFWIIYQRLSYTLKVIIHNKLIRKFQKSHLVIVKHIMIYCHWRLNTGLFKYIWFSHSTLTETLNLIDCMWFFYLFIHSHILFWSWIRIIDCREARPHTTQ